MTNSNETLTLAGIELNPEFPFMNAAGSVNGSGEENFLNDFNSLVRAPGTVAMIGSITPEFKEGNEAKYGGPVFYHNSESGLTYNSMGLPNLGLERMTELLPELVKMAEDHDKQVGVSLAPLTKNPAEEWIKMTESVLETGVHLIEYNAGCPNIYDEEGNPKTVLSLEPDAMGEALEAVQDVVGTDFASGVKISPAFVEGFDEHHSTSHNSPVIERQANVLNRSAIAKYVAYFNTFGGQMPIDEEGNEKPLSVPGGKGGVSGLGVARAARAQTETLLSYLDDDIDVVAAGGIASGQELKDRVEMDPRIKLGSAVTALWRTGSIGQGATKLAEEYAEAI